MLQGVLSVIGKILEFGDGRCERMCHKSEEEGEMRENMEGGAMVEVKSGCGIGELGKIGEVETSSMVEELGWFEGEEKG